MMPRGDKSAYTDKQKRKARHIAESYESRGVPEEDAIARGWATVNKESGGGNLSGSGRANRSGSSEQRSAAARKGWDTRRRNEAARHHAA